MVTADGTIEILYQDVGGRNYVVLKPTENKEELKSITIAVSPYNKNAYLSAAAYFVQKYPQYNVIVKDDYDETSLLTQLGAGEGPVLIDTELTGFENLEKLWQPLDGFLEASGLAKEVIPEALELGKIGGVTYGKGVAQSVIRLSDGSAFKMTTNLYNPPKSENYDGKGLTPDFPVPTENVNFDLLAFGDDPCCAAAVRALTNN